MRAPPKKTNALTGRQQSAIVRTRRPERLIEVGDDVIDVLDANAEPDHLGPDAGLALLFLRHLAVGGGGRMAGQRFGIAHVDEALDEPQRVVEFLAGFEPALDPEGQERARAASEISLRQR